MKIYPKILFTTLPLVILSLLAAVGTTYYFSHNALTDLAETWLETRLSDAMQVATEHEEMLRKYGLETLPSSVKQAKFDTSAAMLSIEIGEQGYIFVVDSKGTIIVHPDEAMVGTDVSTENWFREIGKSRKRRIVYQLQSARHLAMYEYFQPWQWYILATDPENEVYGAVNRMGPYVLILGTLGTLIMALALMIMARRLTEPLRLLEAGAKKIGDGALETRIAVYTRDELGSLSDVFNRTAKQLQETLTALQNSEKHFRSIIENVSDVITILDDSGDIRYLSPSVEQVLGYLPEELVKKNVFDFIHPDENTNVIDFFNQRISIPGVAPPIEFRFLCKDGSWCMLEAIGNNLLDDPVVESVIVYSRDLTARKRAEEVLAAEKERLAVTLRSIGDGVITTDIEGRIVLINNVAENLTGWTQEDAFGKLLPEVFNIVDEKTRMSSVNPVEKIIKTSKIVDLPGQTILISKDGKVRFIAESGAPIFDKEGKIVGVVLVFRDISEKRKMEEELLKTQKLESIGVLAGGIAHDFNNLLMGIHGRTSLMLMDSDASHSHFEHLKGIEDYVKSAADLTKQLLGFARGGKYEVKPTDLNEVIKNQNRMFGRTRKEITIRGKYEKNLWAVDVDRGQIEQVLLNLYVNAWQAMPGGGELYVQTKNVMLDEKYVKPFEVKAGKYIKISVTDTGVGMDEATQKKIFDPFFTTREMGRGTGLGLASVYGIIKNHDGFINVDSEKGEGTIFNIYLPTSAKEVVKDKKIDEEIIKGIETVLFVDDEDLIIDIGQEILKTLGYKVLLARGGKEATEVYKKNQDEIDMIILDMIMPDISGGETYDKLKKINPDIKVLLSSGYSINGQATDILEHGCNGFIQKPFNVADLSRKIREILDKN